MKATLQQPSAMWPLVACLTLLNLQELAHSSPATFSDANWSQLSGLPGAGSFVYAAVVDSSGNLYIGGNFGLVDNVLANYVAKWDGTNWSALGSGMNDTVVALAVSGTNLYAGGRFTRAGGNMVNFVAKWDGSNWSALG